MLILRLILEAAIHWMQIGLPLRILKIVAYPKDIDASPLVDYFGKLKRDWLIKEGKRKLKRKVSFKEGLKARATGLFPYQKSWVKSWGS